MDVIDDASVKSKRRLRTVLRTLLCLVAIWLVGNEVTACMTWYFAHQMGRDYPGLSVVPQPLAETDTAVLRGLRVDHFGYSLQVPWDELSSSRDLQGVSYKFFKSGTALTIFDPAGEADTRTVMGAILAKNGLNPNGLYGGDKTRSNYDFLMESTCTIPGQVGLFQSRLSNARGLTFLTLKLTNSPRNGEAFYEVQQGEVRGLQFGDPSIAPFNVRLEVFDANDTHYKIWLSAGKDSKGAVLTQAEVNAVLRSIHRSTNRDGRGSDRPQVGAMHYPRPLREFVVSR